MTSRRYDLGMFSPHGEGDGHVTANARMMFTRCTACGAFMVDVVDLATEAHVRSKLTLRAVDRMIDTLDTIRQAMVEQIAPTN